MGLTKVRLNIKNPFKPSNGITGEFLVDSGAHYTIVPKRMVDKLKLKKAFTKEFVLADGTIVKRSIGSALVKFEKQEIAVPVVLGEKEDSPLLGVTTLESFGLIIDPFKRKLYESKLMLG